MSGYDITSPSNEQVKRLARLRTRRDRDAERLFVVEEERIFLRALQAGHQPQAVFVCPDLRDPIPDIPYVTMSPEAMDRASYRHSTTGLIAVFPYFEQDLEMVALSDPALVLVAEGVEKPGNLGAFLRTGDGAGIDALVLVDPTTDVFNPNTVRASTGALFTVPVVGARFEDVAAWLASAGVRSVAADPVGPVWYWEADLSGSCAIWIGSEAGGLSPRAREIADARVSIPMAGGADSLNAAVAASLLLYECLRQRGVPNRS